ncbi:3387_t:CDS:2 [Funneliformis geosporum]|uniref:3387_t:CDS:1 n=1 Tax=Funneliformis geosporum TaxID=1117311 RepID=A0A9W4SV30_9GLOM|nr:3387_t:CDS:2 [Funneliformis geosporum]
MLKTFKNNIIVNEQTVKEYVAIFMKTVVDHIQMYANASAQLCVEAILNGLFSAGGPSIRCTISEFVSCWFFIRWTGTPEKPKVESSRQYNCNFENEMQKEKNVASHIVVSRITRRCVEI